MQTKVNQPRTMKNVFTVRLLILALIMMQALDLQSQEFRITEFMAVNTGGLLDEDGDASDWIEIQNTGAAAASLDGWFLTDDITTPAKWRLPAVTVASQGYQLVFASGKNRSRPGSPLHANFALSAGGGSLALVRPDQQSLASTFDYPDQRGGVSFGTGLAPAHTLEMLVNTNVAVRSLIPSGPLPEAWRGGAAFDDSAWSNSPFPAGFDQTEHTNNTAYEIITPTPGNQAYGGALGLDFDVSQPIQITALGCFDDNGNGIASGTTITVVLWRRNNAGTPDAPGDDTGTALLTRTNFTALSPGTLSGGQRFKTLPTPLTLNAGSYTIVAYGYGANERLHNAGIESNAGLTQLHGADGALRFVGRSRYSDITSSFPTTTDTLLVQYAAGTFRYVTRPTVYPTDLTSMRNANASVAFRIPFTASPDLRFDTLTLNITFNDGFVAFLNGVEIARRNAPSDLPYNATATRATTATLSLDVTESVNALRPGSNTLAIQGLNVGASDADFRLSATLGGERSTLRDAYFTSPTPGAANGPGLLSPQVVINEIHSDPVNSKSRALEFVELYNPLPTSVDLSGWSFSKGIEFTFPPGSVIEAHGYAVIAENPASLASNFGIAALGPWKGSLANDGETLELVDARYSLVDHVNYGLGFPWPTVGDNDFSMQLIHEGLDNDLGGAWRSGPPTPGSRNAVTAGTAPPLLRQVDISPSQPRTGDKVVVSAKITDSLGVSQAILQYQIVTPGNYLVQSSAAFATNWISIPMHDDGLGGDQTPRDTIYSAQIPDTVQQHRRLIRYRIACTNSIGLGVRAPYSDDPSLNFAYFVYDGVPSWTGAVQPKVTPTRTFDTDTMRKVQSFHLISRSNDVWSCQYDPSFNDGTYRFEGALVVDGKVYDHIHYRVKGQNSTYNTGKNKFKFKFNRGHWLELPDDYGRSHTTVELMNVSSLPSSWAPWNRGMAGLDEVIQYRLNNLVGVPAPRTTYFQLRVIDDLIEQPTQTQYDGDMWGLYIGFENQDNRFKDAHGLPDGNIFRLQATGAGNALLGQGAGQPSDLRDLNAFLSTSTGYNFSPNQPEAWWRTNVDLEKYYSWRAVNEAVNNTDIRDQENVVYFRDPQSGRWHIEPWDCDLLYEQLDRWGPEATQAPSPYEQVRRCLLVNALNLEFKNRARELQDLLLNEDQAWKLIDEYLSIITDGGPNDPGFVEVDRRRWDYNPSNPEPPRGVGAFGNYYKNPYPIPDMGQGPPQPFFRTLVSSDFAGMVAWVKAFIAFDAHGGGRLTKMVADTSIPETPSLSYTGASTYPADGLQFRCSPFSSPTNRSFVAMRWRLAEVLDPTVPNYVAGEPWRYEITELWNSGDLTSFVDTLSLPPEQVQEGHTYRVRVKYLDSGGRWSHWSSPIQFTAGSSGLSYLVQNLIVSELMYNPPAFNGVTGDEFEFLELKNIGLFAMDLSGLTFKSGITFTFTNHTTLPPGANFLLVRNLEQFLRKYPGASPGGVYGGKLDNAGETLTLVHPSGGVVLSFTYKDAAPWPLTPDGFNFSLVPVDDSTPFDLNAASNWRASALPGGSPGSDDPAASIAPVRINEILSRDDDTSIDWIELFNPTESTVDIGGWYLSDDSTFPQKYRLPANTPLAAHGYLVLSSKEFNSLPGSATSFGLKSRGDRAALFSANSQGELTGYSHGVSFGAADNRVSFGYHTNSVGEESFPAQITPTPGAANSGPRIGPVVITEILYHPAPGADEFIELKNITAQAVPLFNAGLGWKLNGVGYEFPHQYTLQAGQTVLVVATNPAVFRARYSVADSVDILGPYSGRLQNNGEHLELQRPDISLLAETNYVTVEDVRYGTRSPWPFAADGSGASLQRGDPGTYANDPAHWDASTPTPGSPFIPGLAPSIFSQPEDQILLPGTTARFSVGAGGDGPLGYQWSFNGKALSGENSSQLTVTNAGTSKAGNYSVTVVSPHGSASSRSAHLILISPLLILTQPTSLAVRPGSNVTFRALAAGTGGIRYQWIKDGTPIPAATGTQLTLPSVQLSHQGIYQCQMSDSLSSTLSTPARLTLLIDPVITQNPVSQAVITGSTVILSVSVTNTATLPIGYRLQRNGVTLSTSFTNAFQVLSQTTAYFAISGTNAAPPWTNYSILATNLARPSGLASTKALLTYVADADKDGLADTWEIQYFGNVSAGPDEDPDKDGMSNSAEYLAGTDPTDPKSYLRMEAGVDSGQMSLTFGAVQNRTYTMQVAEDAGTPQWIPWVHIPARATNRVETFFDTFKSPHRIYRVVTPQRP